ncbi:MAG: DHA2 family efflux MFS transporter permease subunit [Gaiellaceae bacterium]
MVFSSQEPGERSAVRPEDAPEYPHAGWRRLLLEPARPAWVASRPNAHWYAVAAVCVGAFMGQLDASIVMLAFPTLERDFGATLGSVQWVGLSYLLVVAATVVAVGRLADMFGRKLLYMYGFIVFAAGSAACGLASGLLALDGFRALQAMGAAMMQTNSVAIIVLAVPREKLGRALGVQGAAQALGLSLGPVLGGLLIGLGGWRLIFLVNVPVGVLGVAAAWLLVPRSRQLRERTRFDWLGLALFAPTLAGLLLAVSFGNERGWASREIVSLIAGTGLLGAGFVVRELRAASPMLDLHLFSRPAFSLGIASGMLSYIALFGALFAAPFFLERDRHFSPAAAGALLAALPVALGLAAPLAGRAADRVGPRPLTVGGMLVSAAALVLLAVFHTSTPGLVAELALLGAGLGAFTPPNNSAIMTAAPRADAGVAGGTLNLTRGVATSLGLTLAALAFGVAAGARPAPALAAQGFRNAMLVLAAAAFAAAVLAALRSGRVDES